MVVSVEVCPRRRQSEECGGLRAEHGETTLAAVRHDVIYARRPCGRDKNGRDRRTASLHIWKRLSGVVMLALQIKYIKRMDLLYFYRVQLV